MDARQARAFGVRTCWSRLRYFECFIRYVLSVLWKELTTWTWSCRGLRMLRKWTYSAGASFLGFIGHAHNSIVADAVVVPVKCDLRDAIFLNQYSLAVLTFKRVILIPKYIFVRRGLFWGALVIQRVFNLEMFGVLAPLDVIDVPIIFHALRQGRLTNFVIFSLDCWVWWVAPTPQVLFFYPGWLRKCQTSGN